ncbi:MAG TPA: FecR domain-containing protein [Steroidobacteraceae bacterium]|nr:FecR domain-containing protein [Steroidobacteraceae bacterium]
MAGLDSNTRELEALHAVEASGWVETMRRASPGDEMRFVAWLKESPRNVRDFLLMLSLDCALEKLDAERLHSIEALIARVDRRVTPLRLRPASAAAAGAARSRRLRWAALAAGVLVAAVGALFWYAHPGFRDFETATGEQRTFELEDGSVVSLNTHSRVAVRLSAHAREVRLLRGEALFHVAHDPSRPFLVSTDDAVVQAVGTQFDVYRRDDGTVVAVLEGRVDVTTTAPAAAASGSAAAPVAGRRAPRAAAVRSLGASQEAQVSRGGSVSIREVNNVSDTVAWRERRLIFRDQTLEQIIDEFNRYRVHPIRLEGSAVSERVYSGVFDADDADSLLQVLARDPALVVEREGEAAIVRLR